MRSLTSGPISFAPRQISLIVPPMAAFQVFLLVAESADVFIKCRFAKVL
jgi:hypothetical protein